jgi:hypothetical protein
MGMANRWIGTKKPAAAGFFEVHDAKASCMEAAEAALN